MAFLNFTDALMESKRRARLQGREVTQQEAAGISEGVAREAGNKAVQVEQLAQQKSQFEQKLQFERETAGNQYALAQKQFDEQIRQYNMSSETQKQQFGEQMQYQMAQSAAEVERWRTEYDTKNKQWEAQFAVQQSQFDRSLQDQQSQFDRSLQETVATREAQQAAADDGGGSCTIVSFLFGRDSREHRLTKLFCARFMTRKALIGYYQLAMTAKNILMRFPALIPGARERLAVPFIRYISWRLGRVECVPWTTKVWGRAVIAACRARHAMGRLKYFPDGSVKCLEAVDKRTRAQEA